MDYSIIISFTLKRDWMRFSFKLEFKQAVCELNFTINLNLINLIQSAGRHHAFCVIKLILFISTKLRMERDQSKRGRRPRFCMKYNVKGSRGV